MPRVKFDYIVSFSSEDPEHPASNLLSLEVSKKKWLSAAGETSASVVLQLEKAVQIGTVAVGAHHAALVEVLVGRSESPADPYQVLVASSVFLSPSESRKAEGAGVERVRTFSAPAPATGAGAGAGGTVWAQRWDRLRLSLSQPYNKHCKFGLSFVHCFTPETAPVGARGSSLESALAAGAGATGAGALFADEDEDEFKPGELFAQHKLQANTETTRDTGGQIRRATSHVLRTSSSEGGGDGGGGGGGGGARLARRRMHGDDTASERDQKRKRDPSRERARGDRHRHDGRIHSSQERDGATSRGGGARGTRDKDDKHRDMSRDTTDESRESSKKKDSLKRKRAEGGAGGGGGGGVLAGVVCVLSGYLHPRRGALRAALLALGARVRPHWGPGCTHLICAFPKTPKLLALRRGEGGERVPAVTARWVEECARLQRRLPEEWYSTEPARRLPVPPGAGAGAGAIVADDSEDTDDEIERVGRESRDRRDRRDSPDSAEHRVQGSVSDGGEGEGEGDTTDGEGEEGGGEEEEEEVGVERARALPPLLRDMVFVPAPAGRHVDRYVLAYGGTILPLEEVEGAVYALCEGAGAGAGAGAGGVRRLRLRWLWRAHEEGRLPPLDAYSIDS